MDYISDNEYMQIRMNSISDLVNRDLVMLRKENEALLRRAEAAEKIVGEYAESARAIALWLSAFCDKSLSHPSMISNAARKVSLAYADMEARAEKAERERDAAISDLTYIARTYTVDLCDDLVCQYCKHYQNVNTGCPGWTENDCFEWRGKKEE